MIKRLIISIALVMTIFVITSSKAIAQANLKSSKDTTVTLTLPKSTFRNIIKDIESGKYYFQEYRLSNQSVNFLTQKINLQDSIIKIYKQKDNNYEKMLKNDSLVDKQKDIVITGFQKEIKGLKVKNTFI